MRHIGKWLMPLPVLILCAPPALLAEEGHKPFSATMETGGAGLAVSDDISRVNEYSSIRTEPGINPYGKLDIRVDKGGVELDLNSRYLDSRDQTHGARIDVKRFFKSSFSYDAFQHWLDHDKLQYLDASIPAAPVAGAFDTTGAILGVPTATGTTNLYAYTANPIGPNFAPNFLVTRRSDGARFVTNVAPSDTATYAVQQLGRASLYGEDMVPNQDFSIVRREWKSNSDFTIPQLPNLTFHFGFREETREGWEQSIGMSKCTSCHITGQSKQISESTRDLTAGVTGKFGLLTMNYTYLNRQFRENGADPVRRYDPAPSPGAALPANYYTGANSPPTFDNRMLYDYRDGYLPYDVTPDSNKDSHVVKAKVDLPRDTTVFASYVKATVDSDKTDDPGYFTLDKKTLESEYDAWSGKVSTTLWKRLTLTLRGKLEKLQDDDVAITYTPIAYNDGNAANDIFGFPGATASDILMLQTINRHSSASRDVATLGLDSVYRLAKRTTLRLSYEFKNEDRDDAFFGTTKTHTVKAALNARPTNTLSARASYTFKAIENPFQNPTAGLVPFTQSASGYGYLVGNGPTYGVEFYDRRTADLTNRPDTVHEGSLSTTWSPSPRFSATAFVRVKNESNDLNKTTWKQETYVPGVSLWYAPSDKVSMTLAYTYLKQTTENSMCQGLYDG